MNMKPERKRGPLSMEERNYIIKNVHEQSVEEIADVLNRNAAPVEKFIKNNDLRGKDSVGDQDNHEILLSKLRHRPYYYDIRAQLTDEELSYFEKNWVFLIAQFREDVLYSEELSLKQLIIVDVLMNRSMVERRAHQEDANRLQESLDDEMAKHPDDRDRDYILNLETQLAFARTSITSYTNEHVKLLKERRDIDKSLKTTRDQRVKRIEDGKTSFSGWLKTLEDEGERVKWGEYAELMRLSLFRAMERLSQNHVYEDEKVDIPYLTVESAKMNEEKQNG